jgi:hypothetical protein
VGDGELNSVAGRIWGRWGAGCSDEDWEMKNVQVLKPVNPKGRIDILFARLAEHLTRKLEVRTGIAGIWDGFVQPIVQEKAQEFEGMGPVEFGQHIGFLKPQRKRRNLKGAA